MLRAMATASLALLLPLGGMHPSAAAEARLIPVPRVTLYSGDAVTEDAVVLKRFVFPDGAHGRFAASFAELEGRFARRTLVAGKPIALRHLRSAEVIRQGQPALATYVDGGLSISLTLIALRNAAAGDRIEARNPATGQVVLATVRADGSLAVEAP